MVTFQIGIIFRTFLFNWHRARPLQAALIILFVFFLLGLVPFAQSEEVVMRITSPVFSDTTQIPPKFTCQGQDINPPFEIHEMPPSAQSLALIVDDPDAPGKTWVHWVVFNIPVVKEIKENSVPGVQGKNDFGRVNWGGPCPPSGTPHRYYFKLYALDTTLDLRAGASKQDLEAAMKGHIIGQAQIMGLYKKK